MLFALPLAVIALAAATPAALSWLGHEAEEDGVTAVMNPAAPVQPAESVVTPEPLWRIGGDDDPAGTLLGLITDVDVDEDGVAYILDSTLSTVLAVDPAGEILHTAGREGDGPGEFRSGQELELLPGGLLGVMELLPSRLVVMERDGRPATGWRMGGDGVQEVMSHIRRMECSGGDLVVGLVDTRFNEGKATVAHRLARFGADGQTGVTYLESISEQSGSSITLSLAGGDDFTGNFTTTTDGRVVVYQRAHEYKLEIYGADGALHRIVRRVYEPLRRTDEDLEEAREMARSLRARFGGAGGDDSIDEFERDVMDVVARPDGELWVLNSRSRRDCPAGQLGAFDVFDAGGRFVRTARLVVDYDPEYDNYQFVGERLFVFKEAQNAPDRTFSSGGGGASTMMVVMNGRNEDEEEEDEREPRPYEVICYRLDG
jgi:hypothetical protein